MVSEKLSSGGASAPTRVTSDNVIRELTAKVFEGWKSQFHASNIRGGSNSYDYDAAIESLRRGLLELVISDSLVPGVSFATGKQVATRLRDEGFLIIKNPFIMIDEDIERQTKVLYNDYINNDPIVHTNRYPGWDELTEESRGGWLRRAKRDL